MQSRQHPVLPDNTPIIIGAGQYVERLQQQSDAPLDSPMTLAARACRAALADAGVAATDIDSIAVIRLFSDSARVWQSPFGGSNNPPWSVARKIGASPAQCIYSNAGGTEPLHMLSELMQSIARGECRVALLTGAESIASQRFALRRGIELNWREEIDAPFENREYLQRFVAGEELGAGLNLPVRLYALIENAQAHRMGHDPDQHARYMGSLMAPFSEVAAANPYAQSPTAYTAQELIAPGAGNYPISLPYLKRLIAQDAVNQGAAVLLTSVGHARVLGVDPRQWVFLESYAEGTDHYLSQRADPAKSGAMERVLTTTLARTDARAADIDLIDIYSCFPCAVSAACDVLGLPADGSRQLTVTGGLPFFGGPGNNYTTHALAEMAVRLRGDAARALVTANGGFLSKHAAGLFTSDPAHAGGIDWCREESFALDCTDLPRRNHAATPQGGTIITYTVITRREKADIGAVLAETTTGERFLASTTEPETTDWMRNNNPIGRSITVRLHEERQLFRLSG